MRTYLASVFPLFHVLRNFVVSLRSKVDSYNAPKWYQDQEYWRQERIFYQWSRLIDNNKSEALITHHTDIYLFRSLHTSRRGCKYTLQYYGLPRKNDCYKSVAIVWPLTSRPEVQSVLKSQIGLNWRQSAPIGNTGPPMNGEERSPTGLMLLADIGTVSVSCQFDQIVPNWAPIYPVTAVKTFKV